MLAAISTLVDDDMDDLKDLYSPKKKEHSYRALFLGACFWDHATYRNQESGRETTKKRNGAKYKNSATLQVAYPSASISGPVSSHFPRNSAKQLQSFAISG